MYPILNILTSACVTMLILIIISIIIYRYCVLRYKTWEILNIKGPKPKLIYGNCKEISWPCETKNLAQFTKNLCDRYNDEFLIGIYQYFQPILIVKDPNYIKDILLNDFLIFADRGITFVEKVDPLSAHLINLEYARWHVLRRKFSHMFTANKLKIMFELIDQCANNFQNYLDLCLELDSIIECRELTAQFTTEVIGVCAFGLKINPLADEESVFRKFGRAVFQTSLKKRIKRVLRQICPKLLELLAFVFYDRDLHNFFVEIMLKTIKERQESQKNRGDCIDTLIDIKSMQLSGIG